MKAILYFVSAGRVRDSHKEAATAINTVTNSKVVFRNASSAAASSELPEANEGVAGLVPEAYNKFTHYDDKGEVISKQVIASPAVTDRKLNSIGLPDGEGCPNDREELKEALEAHGIEFHGNSKLEKLVDLYLAHFYGEAEDEA